MLDPLTALVLSLLPNDIDFDVLMQALS